MPPSSLIPKIDTMYVLTNLGNLDLHMIYIGSSMQATNMQVTLNNCQWQMGLSISGKFYMLQYTEYFWTWHNLPLLSVSSRWLIPRLISHATLNAMIAIIASIEFYWVQITVLEFVPKPIKQPSFVCHLWQLKSDKRKWSFSTRKTHASVNAIKTKNFNACDKLGAFQAVVWTPSRIFRARFVLNPGSRDGKVTLGPSAMLYVSLFHNPLSLTTFNTHVLPWHFRLRKSILFLFVL